MDLERQRLFPENHRFEEPAREVVAGTCLEIIVSVNSIGVYLIGRCAADHRHLRAEVDRRLFRKRQRPHHPRLDGPDARAQTAVVIFDSEAAPQEKHVEPGIDAEGKRQRSRKDVCAWVRRKENRIRLLFVPVSPSENESRPAPIVSADGTYTSPLVPFIEMVGFGPSSPATCAANGNPRHPKTADRPMSRFRIREIMVHSFF